MTHRKDLMKKGYKSHLYGSKKDLNKTASELKSKNRIKSYRIVPYGKRYELYTK